MKLVLKKSRSKLVLKKSSGPKLVLKKKIDPEEADRIKARQELDYFVEHRHSNRTVMQKYIEMFGDPPKGASLMMMKARVWYRLFKLACTKEEWKEKSELVHQRYRASQDFNWTGFDDNTKLLMKCDMLYNEGEGQINERRMEKMALKIKKSKDKAEGKTEGKAEKKEKKSKKSGGGKIGPVNGVGLGLSVHYTWMYGLGVKKLKGKELVKFMEKEYPNRKTDWASDVERRERKLARGGYDKDIEKARKLAKAK